ncbi:MAG: ABC transporter ATP-binding protein [Clostridia bacterium]|nr:ABC transporter ATP-binding protein [Clostridia bacterium]
MLVAEKVTKRFGKVLANDNISFSIPDGEMAVLLGPNGAGKSTLIKCVAGLLRYEGNITLGGYPNKSVEAKQILGYVPEIPSIYDLLTVGEHMEFIRRAYRIEDDGTEEQLLTRFELIDKRNKLGKELSKGMQQKLSICCALLHHPKVIVFDEPMVGLDPHAIWELKKVFSELKEKGASVLLSTHMLDSIGEDWDMIYIMKKGSVAAICEHDGSQPDKSVEELFFEITEGTVPQ